MEQSLNATVEILTIAGPVDAARQIRSALGWYGLSGTLPRVRFVEAVIGAVAEAFARIDRAFDSDAFVAACVG